MASHSKRKAARAGMELQVKCRYGDQQLDLLTRDISRTGMFICLEDRKIAVGTQLAIGLRLPGNQEPFQLHGRVVRQVAASGYGPGGIGVQLLFPDAETRDRFGRRVDRASIEYLASQLYDRVNESQTRDHTASFHTHDRSMSTLSFDSIDLDT